MIGTGVVTAVLGIAVMLSALTVTGAGRLLLVVCGAIVILCSAAPIVVGLRRYGRTTRLPAPLRGANAGPPAIFTVVLGDGSQVKAAVFRGGYALAPATDPPLDA